MLKHCFLLLYWAALSSLEYIIFFRLENLAVSFALHKIITFFDQGNHKVVSNYTQGQSLQVFSDINIKSMKNCVIICPLKMLYDILEHKSIFLWEISKNYAFVWL
jgi:hypothetical protein